MVALGSPHPAESCCGASIGSINICISPGCRRALVLSAGRLIYHPAWERSGQRYGIRALLPAVNSRAAQGRAGARQAPCDNPQPAQLKKYAWHLALSSCLGLRLARQPRTAGASQRGRSWIVTQTHGGSRSGALPGVDLALSCKAALVRASSLVCEVLTNLTRACILTPSSFLRPAKLCVTSLSCPVP